MKDPICCFECQTVIGYTHYSGPTGIAYCIPCSEADDEEQERRRMEQEEE